MKFFLEECLGFNLTLEKEQAYNEYLSKFEAKDLEKILRRNYSEIVIINQILKSRGIKKNQTAYKSPATRLPNFLIMFINVLFKHENFEVKLKVNVILVSC